MPGPMPTLTPAALLSPPPPTVCGETMRGSPLLADASFAPPRPHMPGVTGSSPVSSTSFASTNWGGAWPSGFHFSARNVSGTWSSTCLKVVQSPDGFSTSRRPAKRPSGCQPGPPTRRSVLASPDTHRPTARGPSSCPTEVSRTTGRRPAWSGAWAASGAI